jgi:hypothetical protein
VNAGDTFDCQLDPYHVWVIARKCDHGKVLIVTVTSPGRGKEETCRVSPSDHPSIKHDSLINYSKAGIGTPEVIIDAELRGDLISSARLGDPLTKRICDGVATSRAPRHVKRFMTEDCCPGTG